jgi:hypothetical protein
VSTFDLGSPAMAEADRCDAEIMLGWAMLLRRRLITPAELVRRSYEIRVESGRADFWPIEVVS